MYSNFEINNMCVYVYDVQLFTTPAAVTNSLYVHLLVSIQFSYVISSITKIAQTKSTDINKSTLGEDTCGTKVSSVQ